MRGMEQPNRVADGRETKNYSTCCSRATDASDSECFDSHNKEEWETEVQADGKIITVTGEQKSYLALLPGKLPSPAARWFCLDYRPSVYWRWGYQQIFPQSDIVQNSKDSYRRNRHHHFPQRKFSRYHTTTPKCSTNIFRHGGHWRRPTTEGVPFEVIKCQTGQQLDNFLEKKGMWWGVSTTVMTLALLSHGAIITHCHDTFSAPYIEFTHFLKRQTETASQKAKAYISAKTTRQLLICLNSSFCRY